MAAPTRIALKHVAVGMVVFIPVAFVVINWMDSLPVVIGASVAPFIAAICTAAREAYASGTRQPTR